MDLKEIREVIKLMKTNDITDFELERDGVKIVLRKEKQIVASKQLEPVPPSYYHPPQMLEMVHNYPQHKAPYPSTDKGEQKIEEKDDASIAYIISPMVGTFYAAPSPESPAFVKVGQQINIDDVVCILEAMKVFNEIKAEISGTIMEVLVENGAPVEFGQKIFKIKKP